MFPALGAVLGLLHPVTGGVFRRGLKFQTCKNILNIFLTIPGIFVSPPQRILAKQVEHNGVLHYTHSAMCAFVS